MGIHRLTAKEVEAARHNPEHTSATLLSDGGSLYLRITLAGSKAWVFRYRERGARTLREMGLGGYPATSLAEARKKAAELREQHQAGVDIMKARRGQRQIPTFKQAVLEYISWRMSQPKGSRSHLTGSSLKEWQTTLRLHAAKLDNMGMEEIQPEDIANALKAVWRTNKAAPRILNRIEQIFSRAIALRYRNDNPALWDIQQHLLGHGLEKGESLAALHWQEMPAFMERLRTTPGPAMRALEFTILTATRAGEVIGSYFKPAICWAEIEGSTWTIPAERMKRRVRHVVPLSDRAMEILPEVIANRIRVSEVLRDALGEFKVEATVHGFRSTFRDWCAENGVDDRLAEFSLAHRLPDTTEAAYYRTTRVEERRAVMQRWADFCAGALEEVSSRPDGAKVVSFRR